MPSAPLSAPWCRYKSYAVNKIRADQAENKQESFRAQVGRIAAVEGDNAGMAREVLSALPRKYIGLK